MQCEEQPNLAIELTSEEWSDGVPNSLDEIDGDTTLRVRLALVNNAEQSEELDHEQALRKAGLREFLCSNCRRIHYEIVVLNPSRARLASERKLLLNDHEPLGQRRAWWWEDLDTKEVSQEFDSEESALIHMREERLLWTRLDDLGD